MNREQAKIWAKLSEEELKAIERYDLAKHYAVLKHYASGGDVEVLGEDPDEWIKTTFPSFTYEFKYRKKPRIYRLFGKIEVVGEPPLTEEPKLESAAWFLSISTRIGYFSGCWASNNFQKHCLKKGAVYATEEGAKAAARALGWCDDE